MKSKNGDNAFTGKSLYGTQVEHAYAGALSFLRRKYTRDLDGVDVAVTGIPLDLATTNRPGTRFGPAGIRAASAQLSWGSPSLPDIRHRLPGSELCAWHWIISACLRARELPEVKHL